MSKKDKLVSLGSILSYRRSINPSIGRWYNKKDEYEYPLKITSESVSGSVSNYIKENKDTSKEQNITSSNPSRGDRCVLDAEANGFTFKFSVLVTPDSQEPDSNNMVESRGIMKDFTQAFENAGGYKQLAEKYVSSLVSGRVLWRNRIAEDKVMKIIIDHDKEIIIKIDDTYAFDHLIPVNELSAFVTKGDLNDLVDAYERGLTKQVVRLDIEIDATYPAGMELYPSQEFVSKNEEYAIKKKFGDSYGRVLSSIDITYKNEIIRQATSHSQKIGNALRQIDDMRDGTHEFGISSIESYGYSRQYGMAFRSGNLKNSDKNPQCRNFGKNIYDLLLPDVIAEMTEELKKNIVSKDSLYLVASLIRGGVYGGKSEKDDK